MATYEEEQIDTSKRWVKLAKYVRLCHLAARLVPGDIAAAAMADQAKHYLASFAAEYMALEIQKRDGERIPALAPDLRARFKAIGTILDRRIGAGPRNAGWRRGLLGTAWVHTSRDTCAQVDYTEIAAELDAAQYMSISSRLNPGTDPFTADNARELIDETLSLRQCLDDHTRKETTFFREPRTDFVNSFATRSELRDEIGQLRDEIWSGASRAQLRTLERVDFISDPHLGVLDRQESYAIDNWPYDCRPTRTKLDKLLGRVNHPGGGPDRALSSLASYPRTGSAAQRENPMRGARAALPRGRGQTAETAPVEIPK